MAKKNISTYICSALQCTSFGSQQYIFKVQFYIIHYIRHLVAWEVLRSPLTKITLKTRIITGDIWKLRFLESETGFPLVCTLNILIKTINFHINL